MTVTTNLILSKKSSENEVDLYFNAVLKLAKASAKYPVNLDEVWMLVYTRRDSAIDALKRDFIENDDYLPVRNSPKRSEGGRFAGGDKMDYLLTVSCLEYFIARKVRPVFEVYRKVFHKATTFQLPNFSDPAEAARAWAQQYEEKKELKYKNVQLEQERQENKPKVEFAECIMKSSDCISVGDMANILNQNNLFGKGKISFYRWLRYNGYLIQRGIRYNHPSQKSMKNNLMRLVEVPYTTRGMVAFNTISMITPYGQKYFINLFRKIKAGKSQPELLFEK
jgi:phage antirepressor YoqD-like protein